MAAAAPVTRALCVHTPESTTPKQPCCMQAASCISYLGGAMAENISELACTCPRGPSTTLQTPTNANTLKSASTETGGSTCAGRSW